MGILELTWLFIKIGIALSLAYFLVMGGFWLFSYLLSEWSKPKPVPDPELELKRRKQEELIKHTDDLYKLNQGLIGLKSDYWVRLVVYSAPLLMLAMVILSIGLSLFRDSGVWAVYCTLFVSLGSFIASVIVLSRYLKSRSDKMAIHLQNSINEVKYTINKVASK